MLALGSSALSLPVCSTPGHWPPVSHPERSPPRLSVVAVPTRDRRPPMPTPRTDAELLRLIRIRLRRGDTIRRISQISGASVDRLCRIAKKEGLRYPNQYASPEQQNQVLQLVETDDVSIRQAARVAGISRSAAHRVIARKRSAICDQAVATEASFRSDKKKSRPIAPRVVRPYRCPTHGMVTLMPCVACAADEENADD